MHKSVSEFLLENGLNADPETLADRTLFALDDARWQEFQAILDQDARSRPNLKALLNEPGVFDEWTYTEKNYWKILRRAWSGKFWLWRRTTE